MHALWGFLGFFFLREGRASSTGRRLDGGPKKKVDVAGEGCPGGVRGGNCRNNTTNSEDALAIGLANFHWADCVDSIDKTTIAIKVGKLDQTRSSDTED